MSKFIRQTNNQLFGTRYTPGQLYGQRDAAYELLQIVEDARERSALVNRWLDLTRLATDASLLQFTQIN